jgi:hypothetical protein
VTQSSKNTNQHTRNNTSKIETFGSESPASFVRYLGFECIADGRRLGFRVKSRGRDAVEVTFDIPDVAFTGKFGVSLQDAAPMAYEKLVEMLATDPDYVLEARTFFLTAEDLVKYVTRHHSYKNRHSTSRQTGIAA